MRWKSKLWYLRHVASLLVVLLTFWWWCDYSGRRDRSYPVSRAEELVAEKVYHSFPYAEIKGWEPHEKIKEEDYQGVVELIRVRFEQVNYVGIRWFHNGVWKVKAGKATFSHWERSPPPLIPPEAQRE